MMTEKKPSRAEILAARNGYAAALRRNGWTDKGAEQEAKLFYPLPQITRPRVVREGSGASVREWRIADGQIQTRRVSAGGAWVCAEAGVRDEQLHETFGRLSTATPNARPYRFIAARIRLLNDLLDNPTETVEDES